MTDDDTEDETENSTDSPAVDAERARAEALAELRQVREVAAYKAFRSRSGRIRDEEKEKVRVKLLKCVIQACNAERRLLRDQHLDDLDERLRALEENQTESRERAGDLLGGAES